MTADKRIEEIAHSLTFEISDCRWMAGRHNEGCSVKEHLEKALLDVDRQARREMKEMCINLIDELAQETEWNDLTDAIRALPEE